MPAFLHSDSNHQVDNTQLYPTTVSACTRWHIHHYHVFNKLQTRQCIHHHYQGKFLLSPHRFLSVFHPTQSMHKFLLPLSDGGSQLWAHPHDAEGWRYHPTRYPPQLGWDQSRGHLFLSHTVYPPHATYLPQWPTHSPLGGCIHAPTNQHATRT